MLTRRTGVASVRVNTSGNATKGCAGFTHRPLASGRMSPVIGSPNVVSEIVPLLAQPRASVAVTVNEDATVVVGVPEMTPEEESVNPGGRLPSVSDQQRGAVPALAESACE